MLVVTGANGSLGSQIVDHLLDRVPADRVAVSVRDVDQAAGLARRGVRVRHGDFLEPSSLDTAFADAEAVLVVSAAIRGGHAGAANGAAIDAAVRAGAGRVLYTSHQAASPHSQFAAQQVHASTEDHLATSGATTLALRNGFYARSLMMHVPDALRSGELRAPIDGPVSWTAHSDLAEAAAALLADPDWQPGVTAPLTAEDSLDLAGVADVLGDITGRRISRVVLDDEEWRAERIAAGLPGPVADFALGLFRAARDGEFDVVDPALGQILGRRPAPVSVTLDELVASASTT